MLKKSSSKNSKSSTNGAGRTRNWACIIYPESVPQNYVDILTESNVKYAISPLHDKDINADGEPKKPHWHIVLMYDGVKTYEQVKELTDKLCGTIPQKVASVVGAVRYFTHRDNPEKAQYSESDIRAGNGFDVADVLARSTSETKAIVKDIYDYIISADIIEFVDLTDYAFTHEPDWFDVLMSGYTLFFKTVISSNRHSLKRQQARADKVAAAAIDFVSSVNPVTGEITLCRKELDNSNDSETK